MSTYLFLAKIDADDSIKEKIIDFMGDFYPTDQAKIYDKPDYDLAFLVKRPEYLDALLNDAALTYNINYTTDISKLEGNEFLNEIRNLSKYYEDDEDDYINFFNG